MSHGDQRIETHQSLARRLAVRLVLLYRAAGGNADALLREHGIAHPADALIDGQLEGMALADLRRINSRAVAHLAAWLNHMDGRPGLRPSDWRVALYCLTGAQTLREAIAQCSDCFDSLDWRCGRMTLAIEGDTALLGLDSMRNRPSAAACIIDLYGIAQMHGLFCWLIGRPLPIEEIMLDYTEGMFSALDLPEMPYSILLEGGATGFRFPAAYLDHPVVRSGDELATRPPQSFLYDIGIQDPSALPLAERARRIAFQALRDGQRLPDFESLSRRLNTSPATLRRHLTRAGTSFKAIKNSCRRELGLDLLRRSELSIEDISNRLDFCDSDAFRRNFREWMGISPSRYRREGQADIPSWL